MTELCAATATAYTFDTELNCMSAYCEGLLKSTLDKPQTFSRTAPLNSGEESIDAWQNCACLECGALYPVVYAVESSESGYFVTTAIE